MKVYGTPNRSARCGDDRGREPRGRDFGSGDLRMQMLLDPPTTTWSTRRRWPWVFGHARSSEAVKNIDIPMVFHAFVLLQSLCLQFQWELAKPVLPPIELQLQHAFTESRKLTADFTKCCRFINIYQFCILMRPPSCDNHLMCHPLQLDASETKREGGKHAERLMADQSTGKQRPRESKASGSR